MMRAIRGSAAPAAVLAGAIVMALAGCASLREVAQGSVDQYAAKDAVAGTPTRAYAAQLPEDALRVRDAQLAEAMFQLGRKIARGFRPKSQVELMVGSQADADWLIASIDKGIAQTGWPREAVMLPVQVRLTNSYPAVSVVENLR